MNEIEIKIPKEINSYEAKLLGPFTTRQTVCVIGLAAAALFVYNLTSPYIGQDNATSLCFISAAPYALCGWVKPYGMHFEEYLACILQCVIVKPMRRKYQTKNYYEILLSNIEKQTKLEEEIERKKNKQKKPKYKKSKLAIK